jgi:hypothetical protein
MRHSNTCVHQNRQQQQQQRVESTIATLEAAFYQTVTPQPADAVMRHSNTCVQYKQKKWYALCM